MARYAHVILPLALDGTFTYEIPLDLQNRIRPGSRVEIQFGKKKIYAGIVSTLTDEVNTAHRVKSILSILDDEPLVSEKQLALWRWIGTYYMCSLGEVMAAGLPSGLKLASETIIIRNNEMKASHLHSDEEFLILEALEFQSELTIARVQQILDKKTVFPIINKMLYKDLIQTKEEVNRKYRPKVVSVIKRLEYFIQ